MLEIIRLPSALPAPFFDLDPREWEVLRNHVPADVTVVSPLPPLPVWVH